MNNNYIKVYSGGYAVTMPDYHVTNLHISKITCQDGCGFAGLSADWLNKYYLLYTEIKKQLNTELITSGSICRCNNHNKNVGGSPNSLHTYGLAGDLTLTSNTLSTDIKKSVIIATQFFNCVIYYPHNNFFHCDIRPEKKKMTMTKSGLITGFDFNIVR